MDIIEEFKEKGRTHYIVNTKYGKCKIYKWDYLGGHVCTIQSALNKNEFFTNKAKEVHGDRYDYSKVIYKGTDIKVIITCKDHGDFTQTPHNHLKGNNCTMCGRVSSSHHRITHSKGIDNGIVYCLGIIEDNGVKFYKLGFTRHSIAYRYGHFYQSKMPYTEVMILWQKILPLKEAVELEKKYHKLLSIYHYDPVKPFAGSKTECFKIL